jgi:glycosyltransferase involved in cell wall biosynthesis
MCKVSVALATYNGEKFIGEQLRSILDQLDEHGEIIISDNGSTDKTVEIIRGFNDKRITLLHCSEKGPVSNFENALNHVSGDIIFLSDQDDVWLENKVQIAREYLKKYDVIMTDCKIVDENLSVLHESFYAVKRAGTGLIKNLISNTYQGCGMAFRKELLKLSLPFPRKIPMHDIWLGFVAELFFSPCFIPDKLLLHRRHCVNTSTSTGRSKYNLFEKMQFRLRVLKYFPLLLKRKYFSVQK